MSGRTGALRPLTKSGLDLAMRFRALASAPAGEPGDGQLFPGGSCPVAFRSRFSPRPSSTGPDLVPFRFRLSPSAWGLGPARAFHPLLSEAWSLGQRAGPTRLKSPVSLGFRAAVSLGEIKLAPISGSGKRVFRRRCATWAGVRGTSLCISVGGGKLTSLISRLACPQNPLSGEYRASRGLRHGHGPRWDRRSA